MIGDRLKELRLLRGWSQKDVYIRLGISDVRYNHYERNKREPDYDILVSMARLYGVSTDYLLGNNPDEELNSLAMERRYVKKYLIRIGFLNENELFSSDLEEQLVKLLLNNKNLLVKEKDSVV